MAKFSLLHVERSSAVAKEWVTVQNYFKEKHGFDISYCLRDNPSQVIVDGQQVSHKMGAMHLTYVAQPSIVLHQQTLLLHTTLAHPVLACPSAVAGHSLGEISCLAALGLLSVTAACELAFQRGVLMEKSLRLGRDFRIPRNPFYLYAVSPRRCKLGSGDLAEIVRAISAISNGDTLQIVNYNLEEEQYVVAGDMVTMSALGKCLDTQYRASVSPNKQFNKLAECALRDAKATIAASASEGIPKDPNEPFPEPTVAGSKHVARKSDIYMKQDVSPDGGVTLPEERLPSLSHEGRGQMGLKKTSWFTPLNSDVPFHTSRLRRGAFDLYNTLCDMLPASHVIDKRLSDTNFVLNTTGTTFSNTSQFRRSLADCMNAKNVGEQTEIGRSTGEDNLPALLQAALEGDSRKLLASAIASQMGHSVQWISCMDTIASTLACKKVVEISAVPVLSPLFRKAHPQMQSAHVSDDRALSTIDT